MAIDAKSAFQTTNQITGARKWWALVTVLLTMFFSSMDQTVVSTAMPTIINDLNGMSLYAWVFSGYMITSAVTVPIYGKLSDVYGRKPFYLFGLIVFGIGSAVAGASHTMMELVLARGFQGIGAGAMMSMPRATIGDIFNPKERGRWMGVMGAVFGLSSIIGPTLGGWITDSVSWHWVFYINLPFAVLAIIGVLYALPRVRVDHQVAIDWAGTLVLILGLVPIMLGFTWAGSKYTWGSWQILSLFAVGVVFLAIFIIVELRASDPVLTPTLFKNRIFSTSLVLGTLVGMAMFGSLMYLPVYVQGVIGLNAQHSGLVMSPMMISFIIGSIVGGQIMSSTGRYRVLANVSGAVTVVALLMLTRMGIHTHYGTVVLNMVVLGLGIGALMPLLNTAVQNAFPYKLMGTVNSTQQFVSSLGGVIAAPIFGSVLNQRFQHELIGNMPAQLSQFTAHLKGVSPQALLTAQAQQAMHAQFAKFGAAGDKLYAALIHTVKIALTAGVNRLFEVGLVFGILLFIGTFFLPESKLKGEEYFHEHHVGEGNEDGEGTQFNAHGPQPASE
ncbi:MFS transporter [Alicyclobacillus curvatus]|jgi:EmrB/QacA subfamily drug resistance transporter|nr:MFS transporter [Alicyclobacillus curvatus]